MPEPPSGLQAEGVPDLIDGLPEKKATGDAQEGIEPPHDRPVAVDEYGTTAREQHDGESLDMRLARDEPEPDVYGAADEGPGVDDPFSQGAGQGVGRLVEPDEGARTDAEPDMVAADLGTDGGGYAAEESAMHVVPEAVETSGTAARAGDPSADGGDPERG